MAELKPLLPCPFCGGGVELCRGTSAVNPGVGIAHTDSSDDCQATLGQTNWGVYDECYEPFATEAAAVAAWNKRA